MELHGFSWNLVRTRRGAGRRSGAVLRRLSKSEREAFSTEARRNSAEFIIMADNNPELGVTVKLEESPDASPIEEDAETPQEDTNGVRT